MPFLSGTYPHRDRACCWCPAATAGACRPPPTPAATRRYRPLGGKVGLRTGGVNVAQAVQNQTR